MLSCFQNKKTPTNTPPTTISITSLSPVKMISKKIKVKSKSIDDLVLLETNFNNEEKFSQLKVKIKNYEFLTLSDKLFIQNNLSLQQKNELLNIYDTVMTTHITFLNTLDS